MLKFDAPQPVLDEGRLHYNPTGEWMFPSVLDASALPGRPGGRWHLYYSPHDAPRGICLACADRVEGPWAEYEGNPIISGDWASHYSLSHVASPHALWIEEEGRAFLWFHGENSETRFASSADGVRFDYEGIAVTTADFAPSAECSYGRVFRHTMPSRGARYVIMLMGNIDTRRVLHLAWSTDARTWTALREPGLVVPEELGGNGGSPWLLRTRAGLCVVYHAGRFIGDPCDHNILGDFCGVRVNEDLEPVGPHRLLHAAGQGYPDFGRVSDFSMVTDEKGRGHVFYVAGKRLRGRLFRMGLSECKEP